MRTRVHRCVVCLEPVQEGADGERAEVHTFDPLDRHEVDVPTWFYWHRACYVRRAQAVEDYLATGRHKPDFLVEPD